MKTNNFTLCLLLSLPAAREAAATVRLPKLVSDGMVLQRDQPVRIWGWGGVGEAVAVSFQNKTYRATTGPDGQWRVTLPAMKAGGPYTLAIKASNSLELKDVLVGDVWFCAGQSNMELPMRRVRDKYPQEVASASNPRIRQFDVPMRYDFNGPRADVTGGRWVAATPETVLNFTAVGYFFAKEINARYQVPVGLIKVAVGGSPAEAWLSAEALQQFPKYVAQSAPYKDSAVVAGIKQRDAAASRAWFGQLHR
ncbi:sialate O-acetylesterase, partial [Hymenobacter agri]